MALSHPIVFLLDVDNTLLDNDGIQQDLKDHLERAYGRRRSRSLLEDPGGPVRGTRLSRLSRRLAALSCRTSPRSRAPGDVVLSHRLSIRRPTVPIRPQGIEAARRFRPDRHSVGWRRRLSAPQSRARRSLPTRSTGVCSSISTRKRPSMTSSGVFQRNITFSSTTSCASWRRSSDSGGTASRPCSRGREAMLAIRKRSAPFRRPM